jgi:hypothetical protein
LGYFEYLNDFNRWLETNSPTDKTLILYYGLLNTFNQRRWTEWTGIDTQRLMLLARTSDKKTAYRARDALVEAGFIDYKPGKKGQVTEYRLLELGGKFLPESATKNSTESATGNATHNKNKIKTKKKIFSGGGDRGADVLEVAPSAVEEYLEDRGVDKRRYFGVTEEIMGEAEQIANEIFSAFTTRKPTASDVGQVFDHIHQKEGCGEETKISFPNDRIKLLAYAFEQASNAGKPGDWRYINGVMGNLHRRSIESMDDVEDYDYDRDYGKRL